MEAAALEASRGADPCRPPERHSGRHSLTPDSERYRQFQGRALAGPAPSCGSGTPGAATRGQAACAGPSAHQGAGHRASLIAPRIAVALPRLRAAAQRRAARRNHCGAAPIARDIRPPLCTANPMQAVHGPGGVCCCSPHRSAGASASGQLCAISAYAPSDGSFAPAIRLDPARRAGQRAPSALPGPRNVRLLPEAVGLIGALVSILCMPQGGAVWPKIRLCRS